MNDNLKKFAQLLSEELKKSKVEAQKIIQEDVQKPIEHIQKPIEHVKENTADMVANYLSKKIEIKEQDNIEQNRWNDPLKVTDAKFVTFKDMNDHYGLFLQRIQQQMSSIGGGGEVKFRGLDDVVTSTTGTNKFLTYNPSTKKFYFDYISPATETEIGGIIPGPGFTIDVNGTLGLNAGPMFEFDESDVFQLNVATETQFGGVKLGPGVTTNGAGQVIIDSSGLDFSFGDFGASVGKYSSNTDYAILQAINDDEDIVIASNGTGGVNVVGQFHVHPTDGSLTALLEEEPVFAVNAAGQVVMRITQGGDQSGGVEIIGSSTGDIVPPGIDGTMLHITGQVEDPCRVYFDGNGDYVSLVARRWNGNFIDGRSAVLANDYILRINATAQTDAGLGNVAMAQISIQALENQTTTAQGSKITFTATPIGSPASARVDVMNITTANGASATKFTGPLTGDVTGNVSGTAGSVTNALTAGTYLTSGGTYNGSVARTFAVDATTTATASKVVARDASGDIFARIVSDSLGNIRSIPINNKVAGYILAATDNGQLVSITTGGVTINTGVFTAPYGQSITIYNNSTSSQTITQGAGVTLRLAGTTATGNRTLARYGVATIVCVASETFVISGAGLI